MPHSFAPRSIMDMDRWMKPMHTGTGPLSTLDMFDPFCELDQVMGRNMQWLNKPESMMPMLPKVPQKYRITLDCVGYSPKSIKTECKDFTLTVWGNESDKSETGDFSAKEFKKSYKLPDTADCDKMVCFMTDEGQLVIEVPLREHKLHMNMDLFPKITETPSGGKQMSLTFAVPNQIHPEHVHVSIKDRCLVVKAEDKLVKPDGVTKFHYYKKTTLPENTDWDALKCKYDNHQISICAPLNLDYKPYRNLAIGSKSAKWDAECCDKKCPMTYCTSTGQKKIAM
jgi:HSP20 family molecular chaperone IbpA